MTIDDIRGAVTCGHNLDITHVYSSVHTTSRCGMIAHPEYLSASCAHHDIIRVVSAT